MRAERAAEAAQDYDVRDLMDGATLLASTANVIMQLAQPQVGYAVLESKVESDQVMRHPLRRIRSTVTYLSVALLGTAEDRTRPAGLRAAHPDDSDRQPGPADADLPLPVQRLPG